MQSSSFSLLAPTSWGRLARLARKELRETLRDRRTIGTLILMPLLVYPLLNIAFQKFLLSSAGGTGPAVYRIAVESEEKAVVLRDFLFAGEQFLFQQAPSGEQPSPTPGAPLGENGIAQTATFAKSSRLEQDLKDLNVDLAVRIETQPSRNGAQEYSPIQCQLLYRANSPSSEAALRFVEERLRALNERWLEDLLRRRGIERTRLADFAKQSIEGEDAPALSLATLAPLILILMTVTGAVYPAIDLTAGERERRTLETLIAAPVPRMALLAAKYVAVMTVALLTAVVNFVAMTITIASGGLSDYLFGEQGLQAATVFKVFGLTLLLAAFFSAVLLAITSFARSFKEAQAYLIPLTLASLAPGFLALMPGLELNAALAMAPLVNIVLVTRDMFRGGVEPLWLMTATASTLLYAVAALAVAAKVFGADALVFGAEEGWSSWLRRPLRMRPTPTLSSALACLAVLLPAYVLAASWLGQFREASLATRLIGMSVVTALLFGLIPFIAAVLGRVSLRGGFALRAASPLAFLGATALGISLWPFAHEIFLINQWLGLVSLDENSLAPALRLVEQLPTISPWLVLAAFAVAPAVFEEWFFRGYLFGGIRSSTSARGTIVITAILFGAFHVFSSVLAIERMLPSTFLGLFLGWVRWRTSSVLPGMLLHGCHNGLLIMAAYYRDELTARGWGLAEQSHLPPTWLAAAAVGVAVGVGLLQYTRPPETMVESKELA
jgi:ABC-2 type transport system permease protein/sodium transport system permease protein